MKYWVYDEEGVALRWFGSRGEAIAFCLPGYTMRIQKRPPKPTVAELMQQVGEALF